MIKPVKGIHGTDNEVYQFVPSIATKDVVGGITAEPRTTEDNEVKIDPETGKLYVDGDNTGNIGVDGTEYNTLKDRLDTEYNNIADKIDTMKETIIPAINIRIEDLQQDNASIKERITEEGTEIFEKIDTIETSTIPAINTKIDNLQQDNNDLINKVEADSLRIDDLIASQGLNIEDNAELKDVRIGVDGTVYETAGQAVREQIKNISLGANLSDDNTTCSLIGAFFNDNLNVQLNFYKSLDGKVWNKLNIPPLDWIRDADIVYKNGVFLLTGTINNRINELSIFKSYDLVNWEDKSKSFGLIPSGMVSYAPEWFEDDNGDLYATICVRERTENSKHYYNNYIVKCTNVDTLEFNTPRLLNLGNYNLIDTHITKKGSTYYLFTKTEHTIEGQTDGEILIFTSNDLENWTLIMEGIPVLKGYRYEGASVTYFNGLYYLYIDNYGGDDQRESRSYMHYCTSKDLVNWTEPKCLMANDSTRHGTPRKIINNNANKIINGFKTIDNDTVTYKELMPVDNDKYLKIYQIIPAGGYRCAQLEFTMFDADNKRFVANYKIIAQYGASNTNASVEIYEDIVMGTSRNLIYANINTNGIIDIYLKSKYNACRPIVHTKNISTFSCRVIQVTDNNTVDCSDMTLIGSKYYPTRDNRLLNLYQGVLKDSTFSVTQEALKIINMSTVSNNALKISLNGIYYMTFTAFIYGRANNMKTDAFILVTQMTSDGTRANASILNIGEVNHTITESGRDVTINNLSTNAEYTCILSCSHGNAYKTSLIKI